MYVLVSKSKCIDYCAMKSLKSCIVCLYPVLGIIEWQDETLGLFRS